MTDTWNLDLWLQQLLVFDDTIALIDHQHKLTYRSLLDEINNCYQSILLAYPNSLENKVVSLIGSPSKDFYVNFFALLKHKVILVPIDASEVTLANQRNDFSNAELLFDLSKGLLQIQPRAVASNTPFIYSTIDKNGAILLFSSGTTSAPKALIHETKRLFIKYKPIINAKKRRVIQLLLPDHIGGINTTLTALSQGNTLLIPQNRSVSAVFDLIEKENASVLPATPSFLQMMYLADLWKEPNMPSLKLVTFGTERMPPELLRKLKQARPNTHLMETFGTSETGIIKTKVLSNNQGICFDDPDVNVRISIDGELEIFSSYLTTGYLDRSLPLSDDGWYKTGDIAELLDDGSYRIIGRTSEWINVGGQKVLPSEIENCVMELEGIVHCKALPEPNAITGQVVAINVWINNAETMDEKSFIKRIRQHCALRLTRFKQPVRITIRKDDWIQNRLKSN
jgi:acyl-CoA synthetase (AMP-forming)/AMP-acid ligase II